MLFQHMLQQTTHDGDTHVGYFNMAVFAVWVSAWGAVHMAAALAGCRKVLVGTGWTISHHAYVSTNMQAQEPLPSTCRGTISVGVDGVMNPKRLSRKL